MAEYITANDLEPSIKSWGQMSGFFKEGLNGLKPDPLNVLWVYCPLYLTGELDGSEPISLLETGGNMEECWVTKKMESYFAAMGVLAQCLASKDPNINLITVFANKGVFLAPGHSENNGLNALEFHSSLYQETTKQYCSSLGINMNYLTYDDLSINIPQIITYGENVPGFNGKLPQGSNQKASLLIQLLEDYLGIDIENNEDNKKLVNEIRHAYGFAVAFWVLAGYLAFDSQIHDLVQGNGLYMLAEASTKLMRVSTLTPNLEDISQLWINVGTYLEREYENTRFED